MIKMYNSHGECSITVMSAKRGKYTFGLVLLSIDVQHQENRQEKNIGRFRGDELRNKYVGHLFISPLFLGERF